MSSKKQAPVIEPAVGMSDEMKAHIDTFNTTLGNLMEQTPMADDLQAAVIGSLLVEYGLIMLKSAGLQPESIEQSVKNRLALRTKLLMLVPDHMADRALAKRGKS